MSQCDIDGQRKRRKGVGAAIRRSIPVRTFADWRDPPPGFFEIDMVEHCGGPKTDGDFVHTLTLAEKPSFCLTSLPCGTYSHSRSSQLAVVDTRLAFGCSRFATRLNPNGAPCEKGGK